MNIVLVNDYGYVNGGAAKVAISSAVALAQAGNQVVFICSVGPVSNELNTPNLSVHCLEQPPYNESPVRRRVFSGLWDGAAGSHLRKVLSSLPARDTVVHVHSNRDALSNSVLQEVLKLGIPLVFTCHEYGLACPYASFFDHKTNLPCTRRALSLDCLTAHCNRKGYDKKIWTYLRQSIQNGYVGLPDRAGAVVYVSDFSRKILEPYVGAAPLQRVIRNPATFQRQSKRSTPKEPLFLFVGLLTPGKDPVTAARASVEANMRIRFVGDGELRPEVLAANPHAEVTGWLEPERVREEMRQATALVFPTRWYETQGLVVQEAAALGVPSIVTSVSAASEQVAHGVTGFVVPPGDSSAVAQAMKDLSSPPVACELGEAAYESFWSNPPTLARHVEELLALYTEVLGRG